MITFFKSYRAIKYIAQLEGKSVQSMVEELIACWHNEKHRETLERIGLAAGKLAASQWHEEPAAKPAPKKRGRLPKAKQLELEPPKRTRRAPTAQARRNISRGVTLAWAKRKLERAGIK